MSYIRIGNALINLKEVNDLTLANNHIQVKYITGEITLILFKNQDDASFAFDSATNDIVLPTGALNEKS